MGNDEPTEERKAYGKKNSYEEGVFEINTGQEADESADCFPDPLHTLIY